LVPVEIPESIRDLRPELVFDGERDFFLSLDLERLRFFSPEVTFWSLTAEEDLDLCLFLSFLSFFFFLASESFDLDRALSFFKEDAADSTLD